MFESLIKNPVIYEYVHRFPKADWRKCIESTLLVGIQECDKQKCQNLPEVQSLACETRTEITQSTSPRPPKPVWKRNKENNPQVANQNHLRQRSFQESHSKPNQQPSKQAAISIADDFLRSPLINGLTVTTTKNNPALSRSGSTSRYKSTSMDYRGEELAFRILSPTVYDNAHFSTSPKLFSFAGKNSNILFKNQRSQSVTPRRDIILPDLVEPPTDTLNKVKKAIRNAEASLKQLVPEFEEGKINKTSSFMSPTREQVFQRRLKSEIPPIGSYNPQYDYFHRKKPSVIFPRSPVNRLISDTFTEDWLSPKSSHTPGHAATKAELNIKGILFSKYTPRPKITSGFPNPSEKRFVIQRKTFYKEKQKQAPNFGLRSPRPDLFYRL